MREDWERVKSLVSDGSELSEKALRAIACSNCSAPLRVLLHTGRIFDQPGESGRNLCHHLAVFGNYEPFEELAAQIPRDKAAELYMARDSEGFTVSELVDKLIKVCDERAYGELEKQYFFREEWSTSGCDNAADPCTCELCEGDSERLYWEDGFSRCGSRNNVLG